MDDCFADDARQRNPSRSGMGPLVSIGGIHVPSLAVGKLEKDINTLCAVSGFPAGEEFKWSPGQELWMRDHLVGQDREDFFMSVLTLAQERDAGAIVVVVL